MQALTAAEPGLDASRLARLADHLDRNYVAPGKIAGCQIAVMHRGAVAYSASLGHMDRERSKLVDEDTIFRIYSMTKPIVSVALMTLLERGYFQLDDAVYRFVPSWRNLRVWVSGHGDGMQTEALQRPITFRDVLTHQAGFTYGGVLALPGVEDHPVDAIYKSLGIRQPGNRDSAREFLEKMSQVPLRYQPGKAWMYSLSTDVCGALIEVISGRPLAAFLDEEIFRPLGMSDTAFWVSPGKSHRLAANYRRGDNRSLQLLDDPATSSLLEEPLFKSGGGGLVGTTRDYLKFCEMLRLGGALDGKLIIGSRTLALMRRNHLTNGASLSDHAIGAFSETAYNGVGFGLGFATTLDEVAAGTFGAGDFYWGGAASTLFWVDPTEELSVVFMTQFMPSSIYNFRGQLKSIIYSALT